MLQYIIKKILLHPWQVGMGMDNTEVEGQGISEHALCHVSNWHHVYAGMKIYIVNSS